MTWIGRTVDIEAAPVNEQRLLRQLIHEHGFKIDHTHVTGVYYDKNGIRYFDIPDIFWMKPEEMNELNEEFKSRLLRA